MRLLHAADVRALDRRAIESFDVPGVLLMENAGAGATRALIQAIRHKEKKTIAIFAGPGNNGGDGYVMARHLLNAGYHVHVYLCVAPAKIGGDALVNYRILTHMDAELRPCLSSEQLASYDIDWEQYVAVVDALLGTGLTRDVSGLYLELIAHINALQRPFVCAVDLPSGLDADTGHPRPDAVRADVTYTFAFAKLGLFLPHAHDFVGDVEVIDIGIPHQIADDAPTACTILQQEDIVEHWPSRKLNSHKGTFGHLLVVAGSPGTSGAALLSCESALRGGVGLCTLATDADVHRRVEGRVAEVMCASIGDVVVYDVEAEKSALLALCEGKKALAFGPGLSQGARQGMWLETALSEVTLPMVIDADGLNLLVPRLSQLATRQAPTILTPHPGEMGRLVGLSSREVQARRFELATQFAQTHDVVLVLKGARTLIAAPDGRCWMNPTGNPGLSTAGSGDVLTGLIGALLAQGVDALWTACRGVYLHGWAADEIAQEKGMASLMASDLFGYWPRLIGDIESTQNLEETNHVK